MAGKRGFRSGVSIKAYYKNYANGMKWEENAERRLERHIKRQPNDTAAIQALKRLNKRAKKYTRNRLSNGHICRNDPYVRLLTARGDDRLTLAQQLQKLGFKNRGRYKKTSRQSNKRVR